MKRILYIVVVFISLCGCNDSFLDRLPETSLVTEKFFNSPSDLALFVNKLYLSESPNIGTSERTTWWHRKKMRCWT